MKRFQCVLQSEAAECGLACLVMIARAHDYQIDLVEARRRFSISLKGAKLKQLIQIADRLGFQPRALKLDLDDLGNLKLPCILHWNFDHFVVLERVSGSKVTICDPAFGRRSLSIAELSDHFTGVALELVPSPGFVPDSSSSGGLTISQLVGEAQGLWASIVQLFALSAGLQLFALLAPFYLQWVIDQVLVSADRDLLVVLGLGFLLALLIQTAIGALRGWSIVYLSSKIGFQWMGNVLCHLLRLPLDYFEKRHLGDITSRLASVQAIQKTLTTSFVETIIDGLMAVVTLSLMLAYSARLASATLAATAVYVVARAVAYTRLRHITEQQLVASAKQQSHLLESLRGIQSLKVAGREALRRATFANLLEETIGHEARLGRFSVTFSTASQFVFGIERILVIWFGAALALDGRFSVGMLIAYLSYKDQFSVRASGLVDKWMDFRLLRLHLERLSDIVCTEPADKPEHRVELPMPPHPRIVVDNVSFRYSEEDPWVVKDCSFVVEAGEAVAIVGPSGCGKSTLLKILLGLLEPQQGKVTIGGKDVSGPGSRSILEISGAVLQEDQLFAGSVGDNISFFDPVLDLDRIRVAAQQAALHEELVQMPMGYSSLIGDMGSSLSGGQKQRLILARALYRRPRLLFLDEATSNLDVAKERSINETLKQLQLTKVIVAHRPETIASADRVLVLNQGSLSELKHESVDNATALVA